MKIANPSRYHYHFCYVPAYESAEYIRAAVEVASPLIEAYQLIQERTSPFEKPRPDVEPIAFWTNETSKTHLVQFLADDTLISIVTLNQTKADEDAITYLQRTPGPEFPDTPRSIGQTTVIFALAEVKIAAYIAAVCFDSTSKQAAHSCPFEWGTLHYFKEAEQYILLAPREKSLDTGQRFLSFSFPMLEASRQNLIYKERQAQVFREQSMECEREIEKHFQQIELERNDDTFVNDRLNEINRLSIRLYRQVFAAETLLQTIDVSRKTFDKYARLLSMNKCEVIQSTLNYYRFIDNKVESHLKYGKLVLENFDKRREFLHLKIDFKRQREEAKSNKLKEFGSALIFSIALVLGLGQVMINVDWNWGLKLLLMGVGLIIAFALYRRLGRVALKVFFDGFGNDKKKNKK